LQLSRAEELVEKQAGTVVARDQARAQDQQAEGAVMADEANLATTSARTRDPHCQGALKP
jgi:membrane fusion protein (multidrug efflux system)